MPPAPTEEDMPLAGIDLRLKTKTEIAHILLRWMFSRQQRVLFQDIVDTGRRYGLNKRLLQKTKAELGIRRIYTGPHEGFWEWTR